MSVSSWGVSWGVSWGTSWGIRTPAPVPVAAYPKRTLAPSLRGLLLSLTTVTDLTSTRIYFARLPQQPTRPAITLELTDRDPHNALASIPSLTWSQARVTCWADSYAAATALAHAVQRGLNGKKFYIGGHTYIRSIVAAGMQDDYRAEVDAYAIQQDYRIWHYYEPTTYELETTDLTAEAFLDAGHLAPTEQVFLAGTGNYEIYRSTDAGLTWTLAATLSDPGRYITCFTDLGSGTVLAGTGGQVGGADEAAIYRSADYGVSWAKLAVLGSEEFTYSLVSLGSGTVLAGTFPGGEIYRSADSGATWALVAEPTNALGIDALISLGSGIVLAGTSTDGQPASGNPRVYRSTDAGATWTDQGQLTNLSTDLECFVDLGGGTVLAAGGTDAHVYQSADYGVTWADLGLITNANTINDMIAVNGTVLAGLTGWTYAGCVATSSSPFTPPWATSLQLGVNPRVQSLLWVEGTTVLAGTQASLGAGGANIYRSLDSGSIWTHIQALGTQSQVWTLARVAT